MTQPERLNLHSLLPVSEVNGPGRRAVIWLQGCERHCPGCCNPEMQPREPRLLYTPAALFDWLSTLEEIEGLTLSGGEPLLQIRPLSTFLQLVRNQTDLSVLVYTGYYLEELWSDPEKRALLGLVDVLIDGPYDQTQPAHDGLRGSQNQRFHLLTPRYRPSDFPSALRFEIFLLPEGALIRTGVSAVRPARPPKRRSKPELPLRE